MRVIGHDVGHEDPTRDHRRRTRRDGVAGRSALMHFRSELRYAGDADEVYAMLAAPDFRDQVCVAARTIRHDVEITPDGDGMTVVVDQVQPADGIPSFAQKIVGHEIHVQQREHWTSPTRATLEVTIPGKPGHLRGTISLTEVDGKTVETVDAEVKVNIPMVGGKLEKLIAELLEAALRSEERVGERWLDGQG
jgi:hypothetical protein